MGKSLRSKRIQRLKAKRRDIVDKHYDEKEEPTRKILEAIVEAPSVYTSHAEQIGQKNADGTDAEMGGEGADGGTAMEEDGKSGRDKRLGVRSKGVGKGKGGGKSKALKGSSGGRKFSARKGAKGKNKKGLKIPKKVKAKLTRKANYPV